MTGFDNRRSYWAYLFARLEPGMSMETALAALNAQYHAIVNDVEAPLQTGMSEQTLARFKARTITMESGLARPEHVHVRRVAPLVRAVSASPLVRAAHRLRQHRATCCSRAVGRARTTEMAVRLSIGASRWQLVGAAPDRVLLLALMGGVAGLLVARWTLALIGSMLPAEAVE